MASPGEVVIAGSHVGRFGMMLERSINELALESINGAFADAVFKASTTLVGHG